MKAISPMIAVVLLIAFTIGVGGLVSIFVTGLTTTSTGITSNQSEALTRCAGAWINVASVQSGRVVYNNPNAQTLTSFVISWNNGTANTNGASSLAGGAATSTAVGVGGDVSVVTLRALCQSTVTVEGTCRVGQACWDV